MHAGQIPPPRGGSKVATIVLIALQSALALITLFWVAGLLVTADPHGGCKYHSVDCGRASRVGEAAWIGVVGSAVLIFLDLVLAARLIRTRPRLSLAIALLCCIGQLIVAGVVFALGA